MKKPLPHFLLLFHLAFILISACSDESDELSFDKTQAYMVALINGEPLIFDSDLIAHQNDNYSFSMIGYTADSSEIRNSLQMSVFNSVVPITAQTYQIDAQSALVRVAYQQQNETNKSGRADSYIAASSSASNMDAFIITITEKTSNYVKGTFSGTVVIQKTEGPVVLNISEGEFLAPWE